MSISAQKTNKLTLFVLLSGVSSLYLEGVVVPRTVERGQTNIKLSLTNDDLPCHSDSQQNLRALIVCQVAKLAKLTFT